MKSVLALNLLVSALFLSACDPETKKEAAVPRIKPEQIVQFAKGFACVTKDSYNRVAQYSGNGEQTSAVPSSMPADCVKLPQKTDFRVLSVDQHSRHTLIEVTNLHNTGNLGGIWAASEFVAPNT